jgi:hypothetical protein
MPPRVDALDHVQFAMLSSQRRHAEIVPKWANFSPMDYDPLYVNRNN